MVHNIHCLSQPWVVLVTIRKRSCGKVKFLHLSLSHSVQGGDVYPSVCWDTPAQADPPPIAADGYCCGRYTSYWNAFLFSRIFLQKVLVSFNHAKSNRQFCTLGQNFHTYLVILHRLKGNSRKRVHPNNACWLMARQVHL